MASDMLTKDLKSQLLAFLKKNRSPDVVSAYLYYVEKKYEITPVLYPKEKMIYQTLDFLKGKLEDQGKLWRETEIKIQFGKESVNEGTKKIYICPFTGKVFGDNTNPNPQDAIYDWVSRCPENTERIGGLRAKRFFVSEDPDVIKNYIKDRKAPVVKVVYSSAASGKLFNSKKAVLDDFKQNHVKALTLFEVQNQNRFQIEDSLLQFIQHHLTEDKISEFAELLSTHKEFATDLKRWTE